MFHTHRMARGAALASALALAAAAAPGALAQTTDLRSPDARDAATTRDAVVVAGPPTWPTTAQPITQPRVVADAPDPGLDWPSAGIGAAATVGLAVGAAGAFAVRRRHIARTP